MPKQPAGDETLSLLQYTTVLESGRTGRKAVHILKSTSTELAHCARTFRSSRRPQRLCFELAIDSKSRHSVQDKPDFQYLLKHRPLALLSLLPRPAVLFAAGAVSGAIGKTITAPLDRVKLLLQTSGGLQQGAVKHAIRKGGVWQALVAIGRTEGIKGYWKGNLPQVGDSFAVYA